MNKEIHDILKQYWGYDQFRPLQEAVILSVLSGKDNLALMPTGGGKSLCFQVPAMAREGVCLVISPLIALMKDQVENLRKKNITAYAIDSGMNRNAVINTLKIATNSNCKFLYVSPERLETRLFKEYLPAIHINLIAVDEAHCISQWGYDFRPSYLKIAALREELPRVPVLALTASATEEVQEDICLKLAFEEKNIFRQSFERPSLSYSVFRPDSKINKIIQVLNHVPGSCIIYCKTRKRAKEISDLLQLQDIKADFYHAGLARELRNKKQQDWIRNSTRVIVCTNAFGMGIDKPDVRTVIHADMPDCLENYYQEAGRAGRDGKKAYAVLLYDEKDISSLDEMATIRFPEMTAIRSVYEGLANYLQIPSGSGDGQTYDFDISDFIRKFSLNSYTALYALKALEQDEWLSFNEQVFQPSSVCFNTSKEALYQFESDHPELEPLVKTLLRTYDGIFDNPTPLSELQLVKLMGQGPEAIKSGLRDLHRYGIISYIPQKDKPQLQLLKNRVKTEDLFLNMEQYQLRKERFIKRATKMVHYAREANTCRSKIIGNYFGDKAMKNCGICDNCLEQKNAPINKEDFDNIYGLLKKELLGKEVRSKELVQKIKGIKKEKLLKVINFLQAENKLAVDKDGWMTLHE
ncbi:MAG: RecQ family ATP-dependent DNA helicase [Terrimonas sp.]|nr:RecQ family ATP-dependent DNA helicase [Terrimonas sp.]